MPSGEEGRKEETEGENGTKKEVEDDDLVTLTDLSYSTLNTLISPYKTQNHFLPSVFNSSIICSGGECLELKKLTKNIRKAINEVIFKFGYIVFYFFRGGGSVIYEIFILFE